ILDLVGYTPDRLLHRHRLLEPAFGEGDFLLVIVERLIESWQRRGLQEDSVGPLADCLRGVELHQTSFESTYEKVIALLHKAGFAQGTAAHLAGQWLIQGDFLLTELPQAFHHVVGNPPYVRQERIPDALMTEYRAR